MYLVIAVVLTIAASSYQVSSAASPYYHQPVTLWHLSPTEVSEILNRHPLTAYRQIPPPRQITPPSRSGGAGRSQQPTLEDYETWYNPENDHQHQHVQSVSTYGPSASGHSDFPEESDISQFHTQDGEGRAVFGYNTPDQVRIEARTPDGKVRGSYSYLDPFGRTIKVNYWDDGFGFHAAGNSIPNPADLPQPVTDTPEVQAAKRLHEQLYAQALQASAPHSSDTDSNSYYNPDHDRHDALPPFEAEHQRFEHQMLNEAPSYSDLPPVYDEDGVELRRYPKLPRAPISHDPSQHHDVDSDSVDIDNPELSTRQAYGNIFRKKRQSAESEPGPDRNGFFYSFHYPAPLLVNVKTPEDQGRLPSSSLSVSQRASLFGAIPVAAVHDVQLAPHQVDPVKGYSQRQVFSDPHQVK